MQRIIVVFAVFALVGLASAADQQPGKNMEINKLFGDQNVPPVERRLNNNFNYDKSNIYNLILPDSDENYYDEPSNSKNKHTFVESSIDEKPNSKGSSVYDEDAAARAAEEKIKTIAFNSREYRLVGPQQKEVEMKDDVGTKMMIALENLGKEATEVWEQVNTKLDKGWTDFKALVDGAINNNNNKKSSSP